MAETYSAGIVTAYGAAVRGGYTGTYEQWCQDMANLGDNVAEVRTKAAQAAQSAGNAAGSATAAAGSAGSAAGSASEAASSAGKAEDAQGAAETAQGKAEEAQAAAETAQGKAEDAQTAAETAQGKAEDAQEAAEQAQSDAEAAAQSVSQSAAQISQNTSDIGDLKSAVNDPATGLDSKAPAIIDSASGTIASFPDGADGLPIHKLTVDIEPVQAGSGDPSPDNVKPISGWTEANVTRTGFNVWDEEWELGKFNTTTGGNTSGSTQIRSKNYIPIIGGISYYLKTSVVSWTIFFDIDKNVIQSPTIQGAYDTSGNSVAFFANSIFTPPVDARYMRFYIVEAYGSKYNHDICINISDPAKNGTYEPGHVVTYPISFPDSAGTVYGGTLDVTSGVLTVDRKYISLSGFSWNPNRTGTYNYECYVDIAGKKVGVANVISDKLKTAAYVDDLDYAVHGFQNDIAIAVRVPKTAASTPAEMAQWVDSNDIHVCYELATTLAIHLDPVAVITLLGTNNIWADCGPVSVEYPADTKLYIQKINAPADDDMTADAQIASGKYFIVGNNLYLSTTTIPAGDTIIPGTNCTKTDLAAALNALNT